MRLLNKLKSLPRTYYIIGVPLLCGIIIGTTITLSIPHVKAAATIYQSGSQSDTNVPIDPNAQGHATLTVHTDPPTQTPTSPTDTPQASQNTPTNAPATQSSNTQPTVAPCK